MKKILATFLTFCLLAINTIPAFAASSRTNCPTSCPTSCPTCCPCEQVLCKEHLDIVKKGCCNNTVTITNYRKIICANNVIAVLFECKFSSKCAHAGDVVNFVLPQALYTQEGTLILPKCTKLVAEVTYIQQPKWFNKNARVRLLFKCVILPDGRVMDICAKPCTEDGMLKEGPWMTAGKIVLSTVTFGILGGGAGVGFGFIPNPAKVGVGIGAGIAIGCGVGLLSALVNKGLAYKAKACEQIFIVFPCDTSIYN